MRQTGFAIFKFSIMLLAILIMPAKKNYAQTPTDAIMMNKGQLCFDLAYHHDSWKEYWEGTKKRENGNIGTLTKHSIAPMFALGITDRINFMGGLSYIMTRPSAGQIEGTEGFQNLNLAVKVDALDMELGPGRLNILATVGFSTPISDYVPDYAYSIGLGCTEGSLRPIVQYKLNNGFLQGYRPVTICAAVAPCHVITIILHKLTSVMKWICRMPSTILQPLVMKRPMQPSEQKPFMVD